MLKRRLSAIQKYTAFLNRFYLVFLAVSLVSMVISIGLMGLFMFPVVGVITYFFMYGFLLVADKMFRVIQLPAKLSGGLFLRFFTNVALVIFSIAYLGSILVSVFWRVPDASSVLCIAGLGSIIKFRKKSGS